ncbi:bifunctional UDP-sugar hydrolase/5'-nucleotidase UshA [Gilliamella sp. ESL0405]|uniref:bifunctional UDP-sugar hydrolase/5'-nucleotidase UshA n=1 Tax=Gilliamella sp. ESL0405 TaxID=2704653 RepID=UPI001C6A370E|nr:bifunctional UDP-sugar hydrolase/5'-nucleotidase UshA [Gilliamella sp. ESL0405]QYN47175.1 bifunctional UDP-sugar hydrolase/5'-nucleotidase [Gilliamella sp. ESL0405]
MNGLKLNKKLSLLFILGLFSVNAIAAVATKQSIAPTWKKNKPYSFTILHTNDHHGRFWQNDIGEYGLAAQKTVVDEIRKEVTAKGGKLLLLSGGDINTGVPESDVLQAKPDFIGMNEIGYDAMAVGNHEFDHPLSIIREQQKWAHFPFLSANTYFKGTNNRVFDAYKMFDLNGIKVAVFGLTTDDTIYLASPKNTDGVEFRQTLPEAQKIIAQIKKTERPDMIIAVTHMGHFENGEHGTMAPGDVELARGLETGDLDMIVGGHSQNPVCMASSNKRITEYVPGTPCSPDQQNGTWIVQAHEWGKYVGRADFVFLNGKITLQNYQLIPINLKKEVDNGNDTKKLEYYTKQIAQDEQLFEKLKPYQEQGKQQLLVKSGELIGRLEGERSVVRYQQSNLGQLLLSAFIEKTHADVGIMAGGMIRDSLIEGDITYRDILKVEPFGNSVVYFELTGSELIDYLKVALSKKQGSGGFTHLKNITLTRSGNNIEEVKINNEPIDLQKMYRVATLDFLAAGGDGYPIMNKLPTFVDTGYREADAVRQYFEEHSPINAADYEPTQFIIDK